ncbi:porin [Parasutterella excrementihominis]|uniref:porin n=1 Tax=Parasutterella excrementihominis TaxID=487175 RepID=UPI00351FD51F
MKKTLIAAAVMAASGVAFAASNVTLYGVIEEGVVLEKAKHGDTLVKLQSGFDQGSRWGIKGVEDLGNGYAVGFILEQGFNADSGNESVAGKAFSRESFLYLTGDFGRFGFGRTGALSFAQTQAILTGWAFGTSYGASSWQSAIANNFSRMDNVLSYATPVFDGFSGHVMYSNGLTSDSEKWSDNNHYYGIGVKYQANAIRSSLIFEAADNKGSATDAQLVSDVYTETQWKALGNTNWAAVKDNVFKAATAKKKAIYVINYGFEYNLGSWTPMFAYQFAHQDNGRRTHMFGLSATAQLGGGKAIFGGRYVFGKDNAKKVGANEVTVDGDVRAWTIGAAYEYPLSKRTAVKAYAGYADSGKEWKEVEDVAYNGYQVYLGLRHAF